MNSTGFIRGYMAKNMSAEKFIEVVATALSREFEVEVQLVNINNDRFLLAMMDYKIIMSNELVNKLKSPYGVDSFILEELKAKGLNLIGIEVNTSNSVLELLLE